ncbi:NAD-dependent epimerase/dehydratase family protein [Halorussus sp. MSC15.2]|uniref:NAD-dependent epimerase/dehydratase family protein n=1 Tax=Halorussus sp. MSC15.2 TaxID=2283638 RepID=UPI0013D8B905|nr:NAD-dependent epimerase/dehydratase family protein [Halorussus sp. MSC15.2]NEU56499.1 NAD-dependent epimerase/dehydratase family protein [Halorussus sp. MSC15.2]
MNDADTDASDDSAVGANWTPDVSNRTVLITGGAGFVGSHLAEALVGDNEVRVLDDFSGGAREHVPEGAHLVEGDVCDPETVAEAMDGTDLVFHEAALVSVEESVADPPESNRVNAAATVDLLERAREEDARVVLASSAAIYGHPESVPVSEGDSKDPTSPYGIDKLSLDHYARRYHDLYGLETVALRYFNVYGPRQNPEYSAVVNVFFRQAADGGPLTIEGDGQQTRDFVHVSDVVQANLLAATTDRVGEAFNVGTGRSVTVEELAETVVEVTDSDAEITHVEPRPGDIRHSEADVSKARTELGYAPSVSLEAGLRDLAELKELR